MSLSGCHFLRRMAAAACLLLVVAGGCSKKEGRPKVYPAGGTVTYKGTPVEGAHVAFRGDGNVRPATGKTDASGRFTLTTFNSGDGAVPGTHQVTVSKLPINAAPPKPVIESREEAAKRPKLPPPSVENLLPAKYADPANSELVYTVEVSGSNNFKIDLK